MEPRFRRGDDDDRYPSAAGGYFSFQAIQAGFMDGGATMRPRPTLEALEMELREEMIKEEIIARRIAQRRMVEEQARREMEIAVAMGIGGGGRMGRMSSSVELPLMFGPPEIGPRFGRRDHMPKKQLSILEEVKDTEDVERGFRPRECPADAKPVKKLTLLDEVKDNAAEEIEFARRDTEYEERDRLGTQLGRRDFMSDEKTPLREEQGVDVGNKAPFRSKKMEVKTTSEIIAQKLSGAKRKPVAAISGGTSSSKFPRPAQKDWSCALCQVSATCEEGLNEHLQGRKHLAKATQLGFKKNFATTPPAKKASSEPKTAVLKKKPSSKMAKKVSIKVDGKLHEVVEKGRYLWCWLCRVKCNCQSTMIAHLSGKRHLLEESKNPKANDTETSKEVVEDKKECTDSADKKEHKEEAEQPDEKEHKEEAEQPDEKEHKEEAEQPDDKEHKEEAEKPAADNK